MRFFFDAVKSRCHFPMMMMMIQKLINFYFVNLKKKRREKTKKKANVTVCYCGTARTKTVVYYTNRGRRAVIWGLIARALYREIKMLVER